jgi:hypothetical protein
MGVVVLLFGIACLVLSPFAFYQIITKAGFSGWWTFVPYTPWIVGLLGQAVFRTVDTDQSIGTLFDQLTLWTVLTLLTGIFVTVMFFLFAFSSWPALQVRPSRGPRQSGIVAGGTWTPPGPNAPASPTGSGSPVVPAAGSDEGSIGWHRTGAIGSGEQGYWDGQAWTARRQWRGGAWVDLPVEPAGPVETGTAQES